MKKKVTDTFLIQAETIEEAKLMLMQMQQRCVEKIIEVLSSETDEVYARINGKIILSKEALEKANEQLRNRILKYT